MGINPKAMAAAQRVGDRPNPPTFPSLTPTALSALRHQIEMSTNCRALRMEVGPDLWNDMIQEPELASALAGVTVIVGGVELDTNDPNVFRDCFSIDANNDNSSDREGDAS